MFNFLAIKFQYSDEIPMASSFLDLNVKGSHEFETETLILLFFIKSSSSFVRVIVCLKFL